MSEILAKIEKEAKDMIGKEVYERLSEVEKTTKETIDEVRSDMEDFQEVVDETAEIVEDVKKTVKEQKTQLEKAIVEARNEAKQSTKELGDRVDKGMQGVDRKISDVKDSIREYNDLEVKKNIAEQKEELKKTNKKVKEISDSKADKEHIHNIEDIQGLREELNKKSKSVEGRNIMIGVKELVAGPGISIDKTNAHRPIISATGGGGGGAVDSVNGQTGVVVLDADDIDDTSTTNKFTTASDISKLAGIEAGAEVNVNADWNAGSGDAQILNKPTLGTASALNTGTTNGTIPLIGAGDKLPTSIIPNLFVSEYLGNFTDTTAALADSGVQASQRGDWFTVDTSGGLTYIVTTDNPTTTGDITQIKTPTGTVASVNGDTGVVVLTTDDIADSATNRYTNDTDVSRLANTSGTNTGDQDLSGLQTKQVIVSSSQSAMNDEAYVVVANATFTDPSPVEGKGFKVIVRNGTATVGGTGYSVAGSEILRIYHSGSRANYLKTPSSGVNTGDQTSIVGISGTKAQFDTACSDGNFLYTGDIAGGDATNNIGYLNIPQNSKSAAYTTVLADAGKHIYHPSADTTARTFTIDSNANVAYPIGTAITFVNDTSAGVVTIAITSDTLVLAGAGTTGSRTLAANGVATAIKVTSTRRIISGTGLT